MAWRNNETKIKQHSCIGNSSVNNKPNKNPVNKRQTTSCYCTTCKRNKPAKQFSKNQRRKKRKTRRCIDCIQNQSQNSINNHKAFKPSHIESHSGSMVNIINNNVFKDEQHDENNENSQHTLEIYSRSFLKDELMTIFEINDVLSTALSNIISDFLPFEFVGTYRWDGSKPSYQYWDRHTIALNENYTYCWDYYMKDKYPGDTEFEKWKWSGKYKYDDMSHTVTLDVENQTIFYNKRIKSFSIKTKLCKRISGYLLTLIDAIPVGMGVADSVTLKLD